MNGAAVGPERIGYAQRIEHSPACACDGTRPTVETGSKSLIGIKGIDDCRRQSMAFKGNGERKPDKAPAEDNDVM